MAIKVTRPQIDLREEINKALTLRGLENQLITVNGLVSNGKVQIGTNPRGYTGGHLFVHNDQGDDATTKAELSDNAVLLLQPGRTNSTHMAIGQVNGGNGIGIQVTNASRTADWDIALNPFGGNVGIGTIDPTSKLTVDSNISSSSTTVIDILQSTTGVDKQVAGIGVLVDNGGESTNAGGMFFQTASGGSLTERLRLTSSGSLELGYSGAARQQADNQALSIITPADGGGQGIALKRLDSNTDQNLGEISWSNNTQDGQANIRVKTDGAVNTTDMIFETNIAGTVTEAIRIDGSQGAYVSMAAGSQVRLSLGNQGTAGTNTANWIRGNGGLLQYNAATSDHAWEVGGTERLRLQANGAMIMGPSKNVGHFTKIGSNTVSFTLSCSPQGSLWRHGYIIVKVSGGDNGSTSASTSILLYECQADLTNSYPTSLNHKGGEVGSSVGDYSVALSGGVLTVADSGSTFDNMIVTIEFGVYTGNVGIT